IETQLRQVMRERKLREGKGFAQDEGLLASQLLAFCEGLMSRFVRSEFRYLPTQDFDIRWQLLTAELG
ncbi:MAG: nucleoid occlusion factor SlmA, partial [Plesiomonas shigelloides]